MSDNNTSMICSECGAWKIPPTHPTETVFKCPDELMHQMIYLRVTTSSNQSGVFTK